MNIVRRSSRGRRTATVFPLPTVPLPLVQMSVTNRRNQLLRRTGEVAVIGFGMARSGNSATVMKIVVPKPIDSPAAIPIGQKFLAMIPFIFAEDDDRPTTSRISRRARQLCHHVFV